MVHLGAPAQGLLEGGRTDRRDHEFLHVDATVSVSAAVDDVHHRHGKNVGVGATEVTEELETSRFRSSLGDCKRNAEQRVRAQTRLARGAVEVEKGLVDGPLLDGVEADDGGCDLVEDGVDGLLDALAAVAGATVAKLDGLVLTGGGAGGYCRPGQGSVVQRDLDLDRGVATGVEDLASSDLLNDGHECFS